MNGYPLTALLVLLIVELFQMVNSSFILQNNSPTRNALQGARTLDGAVVITVGVVVSKSFLLPVIADHDHVPLRVGELYFLHGNVINVTLTS